MMILAPLAMGQQLQMAAVGELGLLIVHARRSYKDLLIRMPLKFMRLLIPSSEQGRKAAVRGISLQDSNISAVDQFSIQFRTSQPGRQAQLSTIDHYTPMIVCKNQGCRSNMVSSQAHASCQVGTHALYFGTTTATWPGGMRMLLHQAESHRHAGVPISL